MELSEEYYTGEYYVHENGKLIYKPAGGVDRHSSFVRGVWSAQEIGRTPTTFCRFLKGAFRRGALRDEIERLAQHNQLDNYEPDWRRIVYGPGRG